MMETANLSDSFLSSLLIFLFLETYTLASEQFSVIGPKEPIQAQVGGEAALPCHLSPQESAQHMKVIWSRSLQIVHHYEDGEDKFKDQSPDYQGRTELVRNGITSGNITLRIWNIRAPDEGWYKCHFYNGSHREEADVELCVSGEGAEQEVKPWLAIFAEIIIAERVLSFVFSVVFILRDRENIVQILPWPWEANGILAVRSAFEIGLTICHLWMLHTCGGLVYREKFDWMDQLLWIIFLVYVNLSVIKLGIGLYVICPFQNV
ncbi:myelin-oligodendrocyte glycoprotein-like isoform X1 [Phascolarctos cinereus]|uniref:Myelin-oligodendrocyte glycoprotein-like isoform X1 n=1 Tax=Phascolarctos cinereus TaxID=38626 RepID=A0A6P5KYK0_PHACI|nr:myelin-oligodendrocyte glycoprotein-like isoform X1 [Phascolarctos cinereus]